MNLFVHLTPDDLDGDGTGAVSVEKLGAATTQLLADWLTGYAATGGKVILRPVLDLTRPRRWTSTTHPPPCASAASCATPTASSPAADATPAPATSTTSSPTSR